MNMLERIAYITMSEEDLKRAIFDNPRLLRRLQIDCPSKDFIPRLVKAAMEVNISNLPNVITPGLGGILIDALHPFYMSHNGIATTLISGMSAKAIDQEIFDYVINTGNAFSAHRLPHELLTIPNVLSMVKINPCQIGYIPDEVFTPEMSLEVFKVVAGAYCCLSSEVLTEDVVMACTTPGHVALLNDQHFSAFYQRWKQVEDVLEEAFACPSSAGMTVYQYHKLKLLPNTTAAQKATRLGAMRLMKQAMLDIGVKECWHCANNDNLVQAVKEVFGEALLNVQGLPTHIKREMLSDSLGI